MSDHAPNRKDKKPAPASKSKRPASKNRLVESLEERHLLAVSPQLVAIQPNSGDVLADGAQRHVAPEELTLVFSELQQIDPTTLDGIQVIRSGFDGTFDGVTDVIVQPGYVGVNPDRTNEVIVRFAASLPDDTYRIQISAIDDTTRNLTALRNVEGDPFLPRLAGADRTIITFDLDLGAQVVGVVPQPISRNADGSLSQARNQIQVYFNNDDLDPVKAVNSAFYRLVFTNDTVNNTDDVVYTPTQVEYDAQRDLVVLTFADDIEKLSSGEGTYRLRIGTDEIITDTPVEITPAEDPGSSFATANDLGTLVPGAKLVTAAIDPNSHPLEFPGSNNEPGHRQTKDETHLLGIADATPGITTIAYNFMEVYGQDSFGNDLFNLVTENQKARAREIFELYGSYLGVQFEETEGDGIIVVTGDMRELDDTLAVERGGVLGVAGFQQVTNQPMIILDSLERWDDSFGETIEPNRFSWMEVAMHEIGHILGLGHTTDVTPYSIMSGQIEDTQTQFDAFVTNFEKTFPGPIDIVHGQHLFRPESNDIDMYRVVLPERGSLSVEVIAERQADSSLLDSYLTLYREQNGRRIRIAGNDDYFSEDSLIELELAAGTYFVAVTSTGNDNIDPTVEDSGFGGTSEGPYQLRVDYRPQVDNVLTDATGTLFDGDADGIQGGVYDFWFRAVSQDKTTYVDKAASPGGDGSLAAPFQNLRIATTGANTPQPGEVLRIVGNGGADGDLLTLGDNLAYEIGNSGGRLADGSSLEIPAGVSAIVDAGAIFKMLNSNIHVGSSAVGIDRSESSLQILGTPEAAVVFTSYDDQSIGVDTNPRITTPDPGDWGGLIFQNDIDRKEGRFDFEQEGIFLNYVNQADIRYGGGNVVVDSVQTVVAPIHMVNARPTVSYNTIQFSADAALSANPNSFEESTYTAVDSFGIHYQASLFTPDYRRVGPDIRGNRLVDNSINGLFTRIDTPAGDALEKLTVTGRWDDADIVHVVSENLTIQGTPGGPLVDAATGMRVARMDASLKIDPKLVVKLDGSRMEATLGAQLLAEGNAGQSIIFTSLLDDRYGAGGMFQTSAPDADSMDAAAAGDWGGIYIGPVARGSLDHAVIAFGGGLTRMEGSFAGFNAVETHQGELRITNSLFQNNAYGLGGQGELTREGRGINASGAIFVRGAQPILVDNVIRGTEGYRAGVINIDVNSLNQDLVRDLGRATGLANAHSEILENQGPLIQGNRLADNSLNGMVVRGGAVATESVWDDTDIVHILFDEVTVSNFHTYGGVRLESSSTESLVVKMLGNQAGFQATGRAREIEDRIGGVVQVIGQPGRPVVLTSLDDNSVGAGLDPQGRPQNETNGNARESRQNPRGTFQIDLNFGPLATARPEIVSALEEAARVWEELLEDPITVTLDIELADLGNGTLGVSQPDFVGVPYDQVRTALINDARSHEAIVNDLPTFAELNASVPADPLNPFVLQPTMRLTSANARALGLPAAGAASLYDPTETRDGLIQFNLHPTILAGAEPSFFDYDRSDGIQPNYDDFIATAIHEIGHSLGFLSAVDGVAAGQRNIELNTLDLYRLEPGRGQEDFRNAARAIDPALTHVFYDGGNFDPLDYPIAGLTRGDIPLSNSVGDQASHWLEFPATLGLMDPQSEPGEEANLNENDRTAFDLIGWDVTGDGHAGDWVGILLDQYSHDRNVVTVTEFESPASVAPGNNATPLAAQYLGSLGQGEKDSDETLRLGFTVHGVIHQARDVDVYSFEAKAGTEVWFDIDRTSSTLDSVVELVDSTGRVLAQSDNSMDDSLFQTIATGANGVQVRGLQKSLFQPKDHFSTNPKDAGLRVVLPGQVGATGTYFVRIRSASGNLSSTANGQTAGAYQLQIRLSEVDEVGGSSVKFADIRYARDGVRIKGLPAHSPLTGEVSEEPFDQNNEVAIPNFARDLARPPVFPPAAIDFTDAQNVGNLLNTDRATITIAGSVDVPNGDNVDFYKFEVGTDSVQQAGALIDVIIDLDYADGLARADLNLFVYEDANPGGESTLGNLLFMGNPNSAITEDRPAPLSGDGVDDLSRGTVGSLDPYLGVVALAQGSYFLAISTDRPAELDQFTARLPLNPYLRLEPIDTLQRVAQDHIAGDDPLVTAPIEDPEVPVLFTPRGAVPFHLGDVQLFVSSSNSMFTVDPFTGTRETALGSYANNALGVAPLIGDFALRNNPAFTLGSPDFEASRSQRFYAYANDPGNGNPATTDANTGLYFWMDISAGTDVTIDHGQGPAPSTAGVPVNGTVLVRGTGENGELLDDGLQTYVAVLDDEGAVEIQRANNGEGEGVTYTAITFEAPGGAPPDVITGLAVAQRACADCIDNGGNAFDPPLLNILYQFDAATGATISSTGAEKQDGELIPNTNPLSDDPIADPATMAAIPGAGTQMAEVGVLDIRAPDPNDPNTLIPGGIVTGLAINGGTFAVTDEGHLFRIAGTRGRYVATVMDDEGEPVNFQGLTAGPANVEGGAYRRLLFAITNDGELYALDTDGVPQPIFVDGQTHVSTGVRGAVGLEFGGLDQNLWKITQQRGDDVGHSGANSLYFGEDTISGLGRAYDFAGGASGSMVSQEFSLADATIAESPALYFTYYLVTEQGADAFDGASARDSVRVFIANDSDDINQGQWQLLASNFDGDLGDVWDLNPDDSVNTNVIPLFDNTWQDVPMQDPNNPAVFNRNGIRDTFPWTDPQPFNPDPLGWPAFDPPLNETEGVWRQAKIDLSDFVGSENLRLRFDFSTAGSFNIGGARTTGGTELRAIDGIRLADGEQFVIDGSIFEFELGLSLILPNGKQISDGETLTITDGAETLVLEFDRDGSVAGANIAIAVDDGMSPSTLVQALVDAIDANGPANVTAVGDGTKVNLNGATDATLGGPSNIRVLGGIGVSDGATPIVVDSSMDADDVAEAMKQPIADVFAGGLVDVIKGNGNVVQIIGHNVDDRGPLGMTSLLPGDGTGAFNDPLRFRNNSQVRYDVDGNGFQVPDAGGGGGTDDPDFNVQQEGIYIDDIVIGFAKRGEVAANLRPTYPTPGTIPDVFEAEVGQLTADDNQGGIEIGEYQVEIRRAGAFQPNEDVAAIVGNTRLTRGVTLTAPRGVDVFDGQTFTVGDGVQNVVFEYEDSAIGDGVASGHVPIEYSVDAPSSEIARIIRDAINSQAFDVRAETGEGNDVGLSTSARVDLTANAVVGGDQAPHGIEFTVYDFFGDQNLRRDQGQVLIEGNSITWSRGYGVVVEDGLRDLPSYGFFDPLGQVTDSQFTTGDYIPHAGSVRRLQEVNDDLLTPGVSIVSNVVAFGGSGGIHFSGDPNGFVIVAPQDVQDIPEIINGATFSITDNNGYTQIFRFVNQPAVKNTATNIVDIYYTDDNSPRFDPIIRDTADALYEAIESSNLDVNVMRGKGDELFVEGAVAVTDITYPISSYASPVAIGAVPFGRVVNNTIVGLGGTFDSTFNYPEGDFQDVGILVEDNASPTLMNNVIVNLQRGVATDITSTRIVQGGNVFQANVRNAVNVGTGDFAMRLAADEPLFVDWQRGNFYPADLSRIIDSSVDSLEDRPNLVTVKAPLGISRSPVLAPEYDALGQLRIDDPRVELSGGAGDNVFKDRGAIDRVDFLGPIAQISVPADNDQDGLDENSNVDKIRVQSSSLTRFVIDLNDLGEAETTTGTGMDDGLVTSDTLTLLRDGIPLIEGEDYRFDYQATTNQILLTPLAGLWLPGYRYEIILTNVDQFEVATGPGADVLDAQTITVTAPDPTSETGEDKTVILEFESGYTVSVPQPLSLVIPSGTSGLSAIADRETFDVTNGTTRLTFEFDSTGLITPGRIRIPFTPSSTPDEVAAAVTQALTNAGLGLAPRNLGGGVIQLGVGPNTGGNNFAIDTSLTAMVQQGVAGAVRDGGLFTITQNNVVRTFEFDTNNRITTGNVRVPISYANTQDEIADAMVTAISNTTLGLAPSNIGGGRVHIGGNAPTAGAAGTVVRVNQSALTLTGAPGIVSLDPQVDPDLQPEVITIPYQPSATVDQAAMSRLILQAIQQSSLDGLVTFVNESGELVIQGATDVVGGNALFVPGLRDIAGNALQTNQDSSPFDVRFEIDLPVEMDFGDAPDPSYATLLSSNGARHVVAENVFLGAGVNSEIDGQPNASASGDAGDDGVTFASQVVIGGNVPASIVASTVGYVDAWIDFNADGTFDDSSERVLTSYQVSAGTNQVRLAIPSDATAGNSFARFRFSTGGQLLPTGRADNGEVEDYQVSLVAVAAPIAASDVYSVEEDATLQISAANGLLANDVDPQGDMLVPVVVNSPSNGTLTLQADGSFTYQPNADFFGSDQFSYYVTDDVQNSDTVTVDITVTSVADAPTAGNDQATVLEDSSVTIPVTANDVDPDGALDVTTVQITTPPANGSVVVNANGSVEYTPDANFFGTDTFSYTVRDEEDAVSAPAQVTINVTAVNDAPVATNDLVATRRGQSRTISLLTNDTDVDGSVDPTSIIVTRNPKSGGITLNGDGTITFTPLANFEGTDTFSYTVQDDQGATSNQATVTITVSGGNLSPIANDDAVTSRIDRPIVISVLSNDEDVDGEIVVGSVAVVQQPANGLVTVNADGTIRYMPNTAFSGEDTFRYTVQDAEGLTSNVAIVTVTVSRPPWQNPNDALDVNNDGFISPIDALLVINELNANGSRVLDPPPISSAPFSPPPFVDVSGDDYLSPIDALLVINHLNADAAEGETAEGEWNDSQLVGAALHITPRTTSIASQAVEQAFAGSNQNDDRPVNSLAELKLVGSVFADPFVKHDLHTADSAIDADLLDQLADDLKNVWKR